MRALFARFAGPFIALTLFAAALWALHRALIEYRYQDVAAYLRGLPHSQLAVALLATAFSYFVTTGYDAESQFRAAVKPIWRAGIW